MISKIRLQVCHCRITQLSLSKPLENDAIEQREKHSKSCLMTIMQKIYQLMTNPRKQIRHLLQQFSGLSIDSDLVKGFRMHNNDLKINWSISPSAFFSHGRKYNKREGKCETSKWQFLGFGRIWFKYRSKVILNFKKANTFHIS